MTGFIRGLFGGGKKNQQSSQAFFLEPDDAKTFGNIDYMRQPKVIKHTYAKKAGETEEKEISVQVSALSKSQVEENRESTSSFGQSTSSGFGSTSSSFGQPSSSFGSPSSSFGTPSSDTTRRRGGGNDMDMFRKMAKEVKKR